MSGAGTLKIQQPWHGSGQLQLVLQARYGHAWPDPPIALPVDPDEDIRLLEIGPVHGLRGMRPRSRLEHHRRQLQLLDRRPGRFALGGQFIEGR
jgi:hypothetical protein